MKNNILYRILIMLVGVTVMLACDPTLHLGVDIPAPGHTSPRTESHRMENHEVRNVLLLYSAGYNSLSGYLSEDMEDLINGDLPGPGRMDDVLLIYSHQPSRKSAYAVQTSPVLIRVYKDIDDSVVRDTLVVYPKGSISSSATQLNKVLSYVNDNYPAKTYGMIFSSHATGYLPTGFYSNPKGYTYAPSMVMSCPGTEVDAPRGAPYVAPEHDPSLPMVKSVGQDQVGSYGSYISYEIQIEDFAEALPMYMDYILFDACLMGGVEVACELAGKVGLVGFSQTEVLAEGFDYKTLTMHLLNGGEPDPVAVCMDYFHQYDIQSGVMRSATISVVDCNRLEPLADVCSDIFRNYRGAIGVLKATHVQRYFRGDSHWFYDLVDIVEMAGVDDVRVQDLKEAVDNCIVYKAATQSFMGSFDITAYSGFSMYLPSNGNLELDKYYRTLKWNIATGLIQ
jgi:hypothetical protein